jgi:hypothetical protein
MRFAMTYDKLDIAFTENDNNILVLGTGGSGKTAMIKKLSLRRDDTILVAPSGKAAQNINGSTIQSFFGIKYYTYRFNHTELNIPKERIDNIRKAAILLIDEVSMLRCEILDIVNKNFNISGGITIHLAGCGYCYLATPVNWNQSFKIRKEKSWIIIIRIITVNIISSMPIVFQRYGLIYLN